MAKTSSEHSGSDELSEGQQRELAKKITEMKAAKRREKAERKRMEEVAEAERQRKEAERQRKEAEDAERRWKEAEDAERRRRVAEDVERRRKEAEERERYRMEEEARRSGASRSGGGPSRKRPAVAMTEGGSDLMEGVTTTAPAGFIGPGMRGGRAVIRPSVSIRFCSVLCIILKRGNAQIVPPKAMRTLSQTGSSFGAPLWRFRCPGAPISLLLSRSLRSRLLLSSWVLLGLPGARRPAILARVGTYSASGGSRITHATDAVGGSAVVGFSDS